MAYPWSSYLLYLAALEHRPCWLRVDRLMGEYGIQGHTPAGRKEFERHMERRRLEAVDEEALGEFRRGWCLGSEAFRQECLEQMEGKVGQNHLREIRLETAEAKADRLNAEELARLQWTLDDLAAHRKRHPSKLAIGARIRRETTLSVKRSAERLHLGKSKGARANLHRWLKQPTASSPQIQLGI